MIAAIDALGLLMVVGIGVLLYRRLIHSKVFAGFVSSITHPSPETGEEVIKELSHAERIAWDRADEAKRKAEEERNTARTIQRHVRRKPTPF